MYQDFLPYSLAFIKLQKTVLCVFSSFFILFGGLDNIQSQEKPFVVVLDAGHGGHDSGNRGNGYFEKKIALSIALKIGKILEKINDFKIIYTRKSDVFVDLIERANIANKADADLFVSIHCDAFTSPKAFGAGTFVLGLHENERNFKVAQKENSVIFLEKDYEKNYDGFNPNDPESVISLILMQQTYLEQSIDVASTIQKSFVNNLSRKDRTVKQAGFIVLKYTYMPSVLVETGFLTNASEGSYLNSKKGQLNMANAIAKAIINYKKNRAASFEVDAVTSTTLSKSIVKESQSKLYFKKYYQGCLDNEYLSVNYNHSTQEVIFSLQSTKLSVIEPLLTTDLHTNNYITFKNVVISNINFEKIRDYNDEYIITIQHTYTL